MNRPLLSCLTALALAGSLAGCGGGPDRSLAPGSAVLDPAVFDQAMQDLFPPGTPAEQPFSGQYESEFLAEVETDNPPEAGTELVALLTTSCFGKQEFFFYPDGRLTLYVAGETGAEDRTVSLDKAAAARLQRDLEALNFFELSPNQAHLKRFLADHARRAADGGLRAPAKPRALEQETGTHYSLMAIHPMRGVSHRMHVYELFARRADYPQIAEYDVFAQCIRKVLDYLPPETAGAFPMPEEKAP